eukprot:scaffold64764_cov66-Phaeocystis_antarctica.AAC.9
MSPKTVSRRRKRTLLLNNSPEPRRDSHRTEPRCVTLSKLKGLGCITARRARGPCAAQAACHVPPEEVRGPRQCRLRLSCSHACPPLHRSKPYLGRSVLPPTATQSRGPSRTGQAGLPG